LTGFAEHAIMFVGASVEKKRAPLKSNTSQTCVDFSVCLGD